jgi:hypothetical protein
MINNTQKLNINNLYLIVNMFIYLFHRDDRLGSNIVNYISQIAFAHKNNYYIKFKNNSKYAYHFYENYYNEFKETWFHESIFVKALFAYIDKYNNELHEIGVDIGEKITMPERDIRGYSDFIIVTSFVVKNIKQDIISYFYEYIYDNVIIEFTNLASKYEIPFDVNKTILIHLRLEDVAHRYDYNGYECSEYYRNKILNDEECFIEFYNRINNQAPLSKEKLEFILEKVKEDYPEHKIILLTSPGSDTSFLNYDVIKNDNPDLDLYLLTVCNVSILSRSTYSLASVFFNRSKKSYIPLWGHFVSCGLSTIHDKIDKNMVQYFY